MRVINMTSKQIPVFQPAAGGGGFDCCCKPGAEIDLYLSKK